jgi:Ca-activated chloride channel homolog
MVENFHFLRPFWFIAWIPLTLIAWYYSRQIKTTKVWSQVCDPHLLPYIMNRFEGGGVKRFPWVGFLSVGLVITALAGPVWRTIPQPVFSNQSALVIVLDLSRSMEATDIKPNRITRAQHKISDILSRRVEGQTALIVYAATPFVVSPLTDDRHNISALVTTLSTNMMPAQGSQPLLAINKALDLFKHSGIHRGDILLITDGWPDKILFNGEKNVGKHRLSILGVGTPAGAPIPLPDGGFFSDHTGAIVIPKLNSQRLQTIASQTGGYYSTLRIDDGDLDQLLKNIKKSPLSMTVSETDFSADRWHEEGPWLLIPVLLWAASTFRRQALLIFLFALITPQQGQASEWDALWRRPDQRGKLALEADKPEEAAKLFEDPQWRAAAQFRGGQYKEAIESLKGQDGADDWYNRGNALARLGKLPEALKAFEEAIKRDPDHADAKYNRDVVKKALPKPPESQKKPGDSDKKEEGDKKEQEDKEGQKGDSQDQQQSSQSDSDSTDDKESSSQEQKKGDKKQDEAEKKSAKKGEEQENEEKSQQAKQKQKKGDEESSQEMSQPQSEEQMKEEEAKMALDQWLRRIPDDPGGLLRRKFQYQYKQNRPSTNESIQPW